MSGLRRWLQARWRAVLLFLVAAGIAGTIAAEIIARVVFGLGDPPLSMAHPTIEYLFQPNQDVTRRGRSQIYNAYGMRSGPIPEDGEVVLVVGDSIVHGGAQTDQAELATTLLSASTGAYVGNVSAGSWGPANEAAYLEAFGTFGAEAVLFVMSSHDANDVPTFEPLDPINQPTKRPPVALYEIALRVLNRLDRLGGNGAEEAKASEGPMSSEPVESIIAGMLGGLVETRTRACLVLHPTRRELRRGETEAGGRVIEDVFEAHGVPIVRLAPILDLLGPDGAYRDGIHLTAHGQQALAEALRDCLGVAKVPRAL